MGLTSTCDVHNLLGMPGGLTVALLSLTSHGGNKGVIPAGHHRAWYQVFGGETLAATAVKTATPSLHKLQTEHWFDDSMWWDETEEEASSSGAQLWTKQNSSKSSELKQS